MHADTPKNTETAVGPTAPTKVKEPVAIVTVGQVSIKIYRVAAKGTLAGYGYKFSCARLGGGKPLQKYRTELTEIKVEARRIAKLLSQGTTDNVSASDISELVALRKLAEERNTPPVAAMQEWSRAKELTGPALLSVAQEHAAAVADGKHERVTLAVAWERFIAYKDKKGRKGTRTYTSKSKMIMRGLGEGVMIDTLTTDRLAEWSITIDDPTTQNDLLKRLTTLLRWCRAHRLFPRDRAIPTEGVERAVVPREAPGIVTPTQLKACMDYIREKHPHYLAALAICALAGIRSDEMHGKRSDKEVPRATMLRQRWDHIHVMPQQADGTCGYITVTCAKEGTPSNRPVPIQPALAAWLDICPRNETPDTDPYVCIAGAMERVRMILRYADANLGFPKATVQIGGKDVIVNDIAENAFRHAFISHRLPFAGIVKTAEEAGNSPKEIERSYRVPLYIETARPYWAVLPTAATREI